MYIENEMTNASFVDLNMMYSGIKGKRRSITDIIEDFLPATNPIKSHFQSQTVQI